jgi:hypothetical protein
MKPALKLPLYGNSNMSKTCCFVFKFSSVDPSAGKEVGGACYEEDEGAV